MLPVEMVPVLLSRTQYKYKIQLVFVREQVFVEQITEKTLLLCNNKCLHQTFFFFIRQGTRPGASDRCSGWKHTLEQQTASCGELPCNSHANQQRRQLQLQRRNAVKMAAAAFWFT